MVKYIHIHPDTNAVIFPIALDMLSDMYGASIAPNPDASYLATLNTFPVVETTEPTDPELVVTGYTAEQQEDSTWRQVWVTENKTSEQLLSLLQETQRKIKAEVTTLRWTREVGGILYGPYPIATDDRSKTLIAGKRQFAKENPESTFKWKADSGFVTIDADTIIAIGDALQQHVQEHFDCEGEYYDTIDAYDGTDGLGGDPTDEQILIDIGILEAMDITVGWPSLNFPR